MSESLHTRRRARKARRCDTCRNVIAVGQEYSRHALPPGAEPFYARGWAVLHTCGPTTTDCPRYWELDSEEIAAKAEGRPALHEALPP